MAGFYKPQRGTDYYSVSGEFITKRVPEGTEGAVAHTITMGENKGKTVWETQHEAYEGKLHIVYIDKSKNPQYPDKVCLRFDTITIQMPVTSQHAQSFIAKVRNLDLDKEIKFVPYKMERSDKKGKYNIGVSLYQDDTKVEKFLNTSKGGDLPEMVQRKRAGKVEWDTAERDTFLFDHLVAWIEEQDFPDPKDIKPQSEEEEESEEEDEEGNEIPF